MTTVFPGSFRNTRGFGSLGFAIVVFALSVAAAFAIPALQHAQRASRAHATADELRALAAAFQAHARERGDWPAGHAAPGAFPPGMAERLRDTPWSSSTPIGGYYAWKTGSLHRGHRYAAAIVIVPAADHPVTGDRRQLEALDARLDDGNLVTGNFRLGFRNQPLFVLEH